jgi:hypothetical protein
LNFKSTKFNLTIELNSNSSEKNEMQIGGEEFQNLLMNTVLEKKLQKNTNLKKHLSMPLHLGMC